jgi:hypothetical protein
MCFLAIELQYNFNRIVCRLYMPHLDVTLYPLQYKVIQPLAVQLSELGTPTSAPVHKFPEKLEVPSKF